MKKVLKFLKKYTKESILAPAFKLLEAGMDLLVPLVVAAIINNGIGNADKGYVVKCFLILIALAVLGIAFSFTAQWFAAKASVGVATDLRQALFDHIQGFSFAELDRMGTDTLITRMTSDINQVQNGINLALRLLLRSPFIVFGAMIMAFLIDVKCALIFAVAIPVLAIVVFGIMLVCIPLYKKAQKALDKLLGITRENLEGVRVVRAFCREEREIEEFDERNKALTKVNEFVGRISALMNPATYLLINVATIILIRSGALRVEAGDLKQGDVVALYNYMAQIIVELVKLASLIITLNKSMACAGRLSEVFAVEPGMKYLDGSNGHNIANQDKSADNEEGGQVIENVGIGIKDMAEDNVYSKSGDENRHNPGSNKNNCVSFENVSFSYAGSDDDAITDISFTAQKGQTIGIIGGTGCGKSTLVNLIPRFYDVTGGIVTVDGQDVRSYPKGALTEKIGIVPQKAVLFEGTIRENMRWGNENADDAQIRKALEAAQAAEVVDGKECGLDAYVEQNGRNFSGGQKQRLCIARALVKEPEILILDDSSSALDFATDLKLRRAIHGLEGNMTVFIVSQRTASVRSADRILVMDDGKLVGSGTHEELMKNCEVYQEIYYSQFPDEKTAG
ncbi:MAG: ABC transporter ATP-binding protein/permease [Lachnospiraceae bacterium]|nr:ABC transporter ATP-binding protein/permease [Lachnospiraceae bacterium]